MWCTEKHLISLGLKVKKNSLETGNNVKRQKLRTGDHETLDTTVLKWFLSLRSQNVPLSGAIIQEKASQYAKELGIENVKASDGWLRRCTRLFGLSFTYFKGSLSIRYNSIVHIFTKKLKKIILLKM